MLNDGWEGVRYEENGGGDRGMEEGGCDKKTTERCEGNLRIGDSILLYITIDIITDFWEIVKLFT